MTMLYSFFTFFGYSESPTFLLRFQHLSDLFVAYPELSIGYGKRIKTRKGRYRNNNTGQPSSKMIDYRQCL